MTSAVVGTAAVVGSTAVGAYQANQAGKQAKRAQRSAEEQRAAAIREFDDLEKEIPSVESRLYELERFKQVGELTPELEAAIEAEETELKNIMVDPQYKQAQLEALAKYDEIANEGGLTPVERAQLEKIKSEISRYEKGQRESILQSAAQKGTLTGGGVLSSQLLAQQEAANRASAGGFDVASDAYKRAMEAVEKRGELGGQLRSQEYGEQRDAASAQDVINQFNVNQRSDVQRSNVDRKNIAQQQNLAEKQRVADINTQASQEEARAKAAATEAQFKDKLSVTQGKAGQMGDAASQQASFANQAQQNAAQQQAGVLGGISQIGSGLVSSGAKALSKTNSGVQSQSQPGYNLMGSEIYNPKTGKWESTR